MNSSEGLSVTPSDQHPIQAPPNRQQPLTKQHTHTMTQRWGDEQDRQLRNLVRKNEINYQNLEPNYLFEVTQTYWPGFIGDGPQARNTANQRLRKKLRQLAEEFELNGGRLPGECESTAIVSHHRIPY